MFVKIPSQNTNNTLSLNFSLTLIPIRGAVSLMVFMSTFSIFFKKKQVAILKILTVSELVKLMKLRLSIEGCVLLVTSKVNS